MTTTYRDVPFKTVTEIAGVATFDAIVAYITAQGWAWSVGNAMYEDEACTGAGATFAYIHTPSGPALPDGTWEEANDFDDRGATVVDALGKALVKAQHSEDYGAMLDEFDRQVRNASR